MRQKWLILLSVACGTFMATLDASIVNVALPTITSTLNTALSYSRWVVISYLFSITSLLLFFGKVADLISRKLIFQLGFLTFSIGSLLCGLAANISQLVLFRALQGCGAAMLMANGPAIITASFSSNERGKALGYLSMAVSVGLALGPTLGGVLVKYFSWPSIFFINVPIGFLGTYLVYRFVPNTIGMHVLTAHESSALERLLALPFNERLSIYFSKLRDLDWLGIFFWVLIQLAFVLLIDQENLLGFAGPARRVISFTAIGSVVLFILWEYSVKDPVLNLSLFRSRLFLTANISGLFNFIAISSIMLLMPFYLQNVRHLAPDKVGIVMTAIPLTTFCVAPIAGRLSDLYGSRFLSAIGMIILCFAMASLAAPWQGLLATNSKVIICYLILFGIGTGLFQTPNTNAIMSAVSHQHLGVASALLATVRNFGLVTGTALGSSIFMYFQLNSANFIKALQSTFLVLAIICSVAIFTTLWVRGNAKKN